MPNSSKSFAASANELVMSFELTMDEARRRSAVLKAIDAHWDPAVAWRTNLPHMNCCSPDSTAQISGSTTTWSPQVSSPYRRSGDDVAD